jgi:hypothetical protein
MRFTKALLLFVLLIVPVVSFAISPIDARIAQANAGFAEVLKNTPEKEVHAAVFFINDMSLQDVRMALSYSPLAVKGFRH